MVRVLRPHGAPAEWRRSGCGWRLRDSPRRRATTNTFTYRGDPCRFRRRRPWVRRLPLDRAATTGLHAFASGQVLAPLARPAATRAHPAYILTLAALRLVRSVNLDPPSPHHRPWLGCRRAARTPLSAFGLWLCRFPPLCWRREPTGIQRSLKVVCPKLHMGVRPESKSCIEKAKKTDWRNLAYNSHLKSEFRKIG